MESGPVESERGVFSHVMVGVFRTEGEIQNEVRFQSTHLRVSTVNEHKGRQNGWNILTIRIKKRTEKALLY